jgi:hypothetical protein
MSDPKTQEPSMEEILASIRRIISEDGTPDDQAAKAEPAAPAAAPAPAPAAAPAPPPPPPPAATAPPPPAAAASAPAEDVLELTQPMEEVVNLAPQEDDTIPPLFDEQRGKAKPAAAPPPPPPPPFGGLVSPPQADRTVNMFSELHDRLSGPETPIGAGYKTLEQMTVEVMRPMLKDWLDTHLPPMVERLVQEEIERMVHRATQPRR